MDRIKKRFSFKTKRTFVFVFLLPSLFLFAFMYFYPLVSVFLSSFTKWNYKNFTSPEFLGWTKLLDNYVKLFTVDANFKVALSNSLKWVGLTLFVQMPLALLVALVLTRKPLGWRFVRNIFIIPNIISTAAIGLIFMNLYNPSRGIITQLCNWISPGSNVSILANGDLAFWGVTFSFILFGGSSCLLLMTQIFSIDRSLYEAAKLDGASDYQLTTSLVIPLIRPMIGTVSIMAANYGLLLYNEIALISNGGPGNATYSLSYYIYKTALGSTNLNFARGNTAGVIQLLLGLLLVGLISRIFRTNESYL